MSLQKTSEHMVKLTEFVKETGCDALAIAIGTSHGAYKFTKNSPLDNKRLALIKKYISVPLVLHGASGIPSSIKNLCTKYGCHIEKAKGVSDSSMKKAVSLGINKINVDTDLRIAFDAGIRQYLAKNPEVFDPRKILTPTKELITKVVRQKMRLFGCSGRGK